MVRASCLATHKPPHDPAREADAILHRSVKGIGVPEDQFDEVVLRDVEGLTDMRLERAGTKHRTTELHRTRFA